MAELRAARTFFIIIALAVGLQLIAFGIASNRGFDLTDEGFYILNFRHWNAAPAFSFFGLYFQGPFTLMGQSIPGVRLLGFLLLLVSGTWFALEFLVLNGGANEKRPLNASVIFAALATGTGVWNYYGAFPVPYTPSYNLLALSCALCSTALALQVSRKMGQGGNATWAAFAFGIVSSIGVANKFSTGSLVVMLDLLIIAAAGWRKTGGTSLARLGIVFLLGALTNLIFLVAIDPAILLRFRRGIEIQWALYPRDLIGELIKFGTYFLPRAVAFGLFGLLAPILWAMLFLGLSKRMSGRSSATMVAIAVMGFIVGAMFLVYVKERSHRIVLITLVAIILAGMAGWLQRKSLRMMLCQRGAVISALVMCMPFAYSFGTNNVLLMHMSMASIFPATVLASQILKLWNMRLLAEWAFIACLFLMAVLPSEIVARQWVEGYYTYRLGSSLSTQTAMIESSAGLIDVTVDSRIARGASEFLHAVERSGFIAGKQMIDFTGQSPGLLALCGAVPVGSLWLAGGTPFKGDQAAALALSHVEPDDIRQAWLLTSTDSFSRIDQWKRIVTDRLGGFTHVRAEQVVIPDPSSADKNKTIEITIWRPGDRR